MNLSAKTRDTSRKDRRDLKAEASRIANAIQQPGQSREESRAIRAGLQQGMEMWLRQQNQRSRELDKRAKKIRTALPASSQADKPEVAVKEARGWNAGGLFAVYLPWILLVLSWAGFAVYRGF